MAELYLRQGTVLAEPANSDPKNSPLTNVEVDSNFVNLNTGVTNAQSTAATASGSAVAMAIALGG